MARQPTRFSGRRSVRFILRRFRAASMSNASSQEGWRAGEGEQREWVGKWWGWGWRWGCGWGWGGRLPDGLTGRQPRLGSAVLAFLLPGIFQFIFLLLEWVNRRIVKAGGLEGGRRGWMFWVAESGSSSPCPTSIFLITF